MKKIIIIILITLLLLYLAIIQRVTVNNGTEAVIVKKPWFSNKSGIEPKAISTGTIWAVSSSDIKLINLKPFELSETFSETLTQENIPITFTINMTFQQQKGKSPLLLEKFGENQEWYNMILLPSIKVSIESAIKSSSFQTLLENNLGIQSLEKSASLYIQKVLTSKHIPIDLLAFHFTKITPPQQIITAAIETEVLKQKVKTKEAEIKTQSLRKELEETRANADKAYMLTMNMSINQYLQIKKIELDGKRLMNQRYVIDQAKDANGSIKVQMNIR